MDSGEMIEMVGTRAIDRMVEAGIPHHEARDLVNDIVTACAKSAAELYVTQVRADAILNRPLKS
jgi:hypothetical protein